MGVPKKSVFGEGERFIGLFQTGLSLCGKLISFFLFVTGEIVGISRPNQKNERLAPGAFNYTAKWLLVLAVRTGFPS